MESIKNAIDAQNYKIRGLEMRGIDPTTGKVYMNGFDILNVNGEFYGFINIDSAERKILELYLVDYE